MAFELAPTLLPWEAHEHKRSLCPFAHRGRSLTLEAPDPLSICPRNVGQRYRKCKERGGCRRCERRTKKTWDPDTGGKTARRADGCIKTLACQNSQVCELPLLQPKGGHTRLQATLGPPNSVLGASLLREHLGLAGSACCSCISCQKCLVVEGPLSMNCGSKLTFQNETISSWVSEHLALQQQNGTSCKTTTSNS